MERSYGGLGSVGGLAEGAVAGGADSGALVEERGCDGGCGEGACRCWRDGWIEGGTMWVVGGRGLGLYVSYPP